MNENWTLNFYWRGENDSIKAKKEYLVEVERMMREIMRSFTNDDKVKLTITIDYTLKTIVMIADVVQPTHFSPQ